MHSNDGLVDGPLNSMVTMHTPFTRQGVTIVIFQKSAQSPHIISTLKFLFIETVDDHIYFAPSFICQNNHCNNHGECFFTNPITSKVPSADFFNTPFSVIIPVIYSAGVTSNAGFQHAISLGAPLLSIISPAGRSSISILSPLSNSTSNVVNGLATKNSTPISLAMMANENVPILLAVSPLAQTRSAPTTQASAPLVLRYDAAIESHINVPFIFSV
mmetsp:Transcript_9702/g.21881  ORF Transcript_9702/g.21881 Transcript_9702/m.21881 type:complete len:216 (+) Transcript_9702:11-658(+)